MKKHFRKGAFRWASLILTVVMAINLLPLTAMAADPISPNSGTGTESDPYVYAVGTKDDLKDAVDAINGASETDFSVIDLTADIEYVGRLSLSKGTTTLIGNGYTLSFLASSSELGISISNGATLNLGDGSSLLTIQAKKQNENDFYTNNDSPGMLVVDEDSILNMYDGATLKDAINNNYFGGAVTLYQEATFHMYGGTITNCGVYGGSVCYGGAVAAINGSKFIMDGGIIENCFVKGGYSDNGIWTRYCAGGAVFATNYSLIEINGGTIRNCRAEFLERENPSDPPYTGVVGGAIAILRSPKETPSYYGVIGSELRMTGGTITGNYSGEMGGGIAVLGAQCGAIRLCTPGVIAVPVTTTPGVHITGGTIFNNTAKGAGSSDGGGGIALWILRGQNGVDASIKNATITGNKVINGSGGGIEAESSDGAYIMNIELDNCTISDNEALQGGGLALWGGTASSLTDLTVTGNTATDGPGGGIYYASSPSTTLNIGGKMVVQDNYYDNSIDPAKQNNLYFLGTTKTVNVTSPLTEGSEIGICDAALWNGAEDSSAYVTNGYKDKTGDVVPYIYFTSDHKTWYPYWGEKSEGTFRMDWSNTAWLEKTTVTYKASVSGLKEANANGMMNGEKNNLRYHPGTNTIVESTVVEDTYPLAIISDGTSFYLAYKFATQIYYVVSELEKVDGATGNYFVIPDAASLSASLTESGIICLRCANMSSTDRLTKSYVYDQKMVSNGDGYDYSSEVRLIRTTYTLHYNDETTPDAVKYYIPAAPANLEVPNRSGYAFVGWYDNAALTGSPVERTPDEYKGHVDYYAKWIDASTAYTVTFDSKGGSAVEPQIVNGGGKAEEPADPGFTDHVFTGWYTDEGCTIPYDFDTLLSSDITLYAGWKQLKYTMHYGDGREQDGLWGYNYAEGQNGYYVPTMAKPLPSEVRHFTADEIADSSFDSSQYPGLDVAKPGYYFIAWFAPVPVTKAQADENFPVYTDAARQNEIAYSTLADGTTYYQYLPFTQTPDRDLGDVDFYAQWMLISIDIDVQVNVQIIVDKNLNFSHLLTSGANVNKIAMIEEDQKSALAKNITPNDVKGTNCKIELVATVADAVDQDEMEATDAYITAHYPGYERLSYDVAITKKISVNGSLYSEANLKGLAQSIEIEFAVPDEWQNGTVKLLRAHTDEGGVITVEECADLLPGNRQIYKISSDSFSSYSMIYSGSSGSSGGGGSSGGTSAYTLRYQSNGGTSCPDETKTSAWSKDYDSLPVPVREGYLFTGWFADSGLQTPISEDVQVNHRLVTIYAGWEKSMVPAMLNGDDHYAYVQGYSDGTVRPNDNITRAEVATIFFRLLKDESREENLSDVNTFEDVTDGMWCNKAISTMAVLGVVKGRTAEYFDPDAPITRGEFAAICSRFDKSDIVARENFTDIEGYWAKEEIERAAILGWVRGYTDGSFRPRNYITRAEAMTMINRVLHRVPESPEDLLPDMVTWPDNKLTDWYYLAVQEATNSHIPERKVNGYESWFALTYNRDWSIYQS